MQLRCSLEEKNDISDDLKDLEQMIEHMLIRKDENMCENLNKENIAIFLVERNDRQAHAFTLHLEKLCFENSLC